MPLDAYLNSEADELATSGLKRLQEKPIIPMDPSTFFQFHIRGRTITRYFKRTVREIVQLPTLRKYCCERFKWSDNVFAIIDWDIFQPVYKNQPKEFNGCTNFVSRNYQQEREYTKETTSMVADVRHAGIC
jgi:hypothetical protein